KKPWREIPEGLKKPDQKKASSSKKDEKDLEVKKPVLKPLDSNAPKAVEAKKPDQKKDLPSKADLKNKGAKGKKDTKSGKGTGNTGKGSSSKNSLDNIWPKE
ncbi:MAG: hypothetical protein Q4G69_14430, partial [Planctomycetia bacterium]|nr:hypothetical protein [Planctomycetia bacterium]